MKSKSKPTCIETGDLSLPPLQTLTLTMKLPLPWLRTRTRNPITPQTASSSLCHVINDPDSTLKQILAAFSAASRRPNSRHNYETYQTLIPLLSRRRHFRAAEAVLSFMHRRDHLVPGPTVLFPLVESLSDAGRHVDAIHLVLRFPLSNKVFAFAFRTLVIDRQLDVAESFLSKSADLGFQIQVRYYNVLIKGFCDNLRIDDGVRVLKGMLHSGVPPDVITFSTVMNALGKEGRVLEMHGVLGKIFVMGILPDLACYKILFRLYLRTQMVSDAVGVVRVMTVDGVLGDGEGLGLGGDVGDWVLAAVLKRGILGFFVA